MLSYLLASFLQLWLPCILSIATFISLFFKSNHFVEGRGLVGVVENKIKGWLLKVRQMITFLSFFFFFE